MSKLVVAVIVEGDEDVFEMSYNSIKDVADEVIIIDGNHYNNVWTSESNDQWLNAHRLKYPFLKDKKNTVLWRPYPHEDKGANGKQRNEYLNYLKKHNLGDWCLVLDADEIVDNAKALKEFVQQPFTFSKCYDIHMEHFVGNLGQVDATVEKHFVPTRLFEITPDIFYEEAEHVTLQGALSYGKTKEFCIWHLGYSRETLRLKKKWENHKAKSNIHNKDFLEWWYHAHLFGVFPTKPMPIENIPKNILKAFDVNEDYIYFNNRQVEVKHFIDAKHWKDFFKPTSVFEYGCGRGPRIFALETCGVKAMGVDISKWAIEHSFHEHVYPGNIVKFDELSKDNASLVIAYDVLEHLEYGELPIALVNMYNTTTEYILISVPVVGDPNLEADPTHIIKESMEWWIEKVKGAGFEIIETPEHFQFKEQLIIGKKK